MTRRIGLILAAGRGRRMGRTKQLVAWPGPKGEKPLVLAAYDAIRPICDTMIVVLGHEAEAVAAALGDRPFQAAHADPDAAMFESIRTGLMAARTLSAEAAVVLQPGDQPEVHSATLATLVTWSLKRPSRSIIPEYQGRGGHPVIIPTSVVKMLVAAECPKGLGDYWAAHPELCERVAVDDPGVVEDIDTMADMGG